MSYGLADILEEAKRLIDDVKTAIEEKPEIKEADLIKKLIQTCEMLDVRYKEYCDALDEEFGEEPGGCYKNGVYMEFYIEASDWHKISLALRELKK